MSVETTTAVGGTRTVPVPDPIARDYLLLALRLDQHVPGLVDGYFGPADLKAQVDLEPLRPPGRLRDDAASLRERVGGVKEPDRRAWLDGQLLALETQAAALAGAPLPYVEHVTRCFGLPPERVDDAILDTAEAELGRLLPGTGPIEERLEAWDAALTVPLERVADVADWLVARFRERATRLFGLPGGESLRIGLVRDRPWAGYNWYEGGLRSRIDLNVDLPIRVPELARTISHETYGGHHLEHAWKEAELVTGRARLEATVLLINTPECLISEGLADLGYDFVLAPAEREDVLVELFDRAGLALASRSDGGRELAAIQVAIEPARQSLRRAAANGALMRHAEEASRDEVLGYLRQRGLVPAARAAKYLDFIEHPLWRTYVFVYSQGEALLRRWLEGVPEHERVARFARLLREQLTPAAILRDTAAAG